MQVDMSQTYIATCPLRFQLNDLLPQLSSFGIPIFRALINTPSRLPELLESLWVESFPRSTHPVASLLSFSQLHQQSRHNFSSDFILHGKYILHVSIITVRPHMPACLGVNELACDSHTVPLFAHTAFKHIAHSKLSAHFLHSYRLALE